MLGKNSTKSVILPFAEGLSEMVMEFPAVLRVCLSVGDP